MTEEDLKLFSKALRHYSKRMVELKEDEEIKQGNGKIQEDLDYNSTKALEVAGALDEYQSHNTVHDHVTWVKCALAFYKKDLIESKDSLEKKVGVKMPLKNTIDEIRYIEKLFEHRNWDEPTLDTEKNSTNELLT